MDTRVTMSSPPYERVKPKRFFTRSAMVIVPILIVVGAFTVFSIMMATAPKPKQADEGPAALAVEIATAVSTQTRLSVNTQGEVRPKTEADIASQVSGQIVYIAPAFEPGAEMRKGDVIARIDQTDYALALQRSRSQVARAREAVARARSEASLAENEWQDLGLSGRPSDLTLQKPQVDAAMADLRTAEASVREAEVNLSRTTIRAPFDGRILTRRVDVGDFVAAGSPVASMFAVDAAQVRIPLTDTDLAVLGLTPGYFAKDAATAPAASLSAIVGGERREWAGRLAQIEAAVDARTRLIYGLVTVTDPFGSANAAPLAPGTFVEVRLEGVRSQTLVALPRAALKKNQYVYVVGDDMTLETREVTPVTADATTLYLRSTIAAGEKVVVSYIPNPRDGMKVRDIRAPEPAKDETVAEKSDKKSAKADAKKKQ